MSWKFEEGRNLVNLVNQSQNLQNVLPSEPAVYMWKHNFVQQLLSFDSTGVLDRVRDLCMVDMSWSSEVKLTHSVRIKELIFGGSGLSDNKLGTLEERLISGESNREECTKNTFEFLSRLIEHSPSVYVGESNNLAERIEQHISGSTDFAHRLIERNQFDFSDLRLYYYIFDKDDKDFRQSLEAVASILTGALLVRKIG